MADTLPWVDEDAARAAIAAIRKDSDPTDWYEVVLLSCHQFSDSFGHS